MEAFSRVKTLTSPIEYPVSLEEAKSQAVIEHDDHDVLITRMIAAATSYVETLTNRSLVRQQKRLYLDRFSDKMYLPKGPVRVVDQIQYVDADGATQTLATSVYSFNDVEPYIRLAYGQTWPAVRNQANAVWIDYWVGYYDQASPESSIDLTIKIPPDLADAILVLVADLYMHREAQLDIQLYNNPTFNYFVGPYRVYIQ